MNKLSPNEPVRIGSDPVSTTPDMETPFSATQLGTDPIPNIYKKTEKSNDFPTEFIDLPSKGLLYPSDHPLSSGKLEIKYMTAKEEDILSTQSYIKQGVVLDKLCEALIVTPGVKFDDLLIGDKNALLMAARVYGYGPQYDTVVKTETGTEIQISVNLAEIPNKEFDESLIVPGVNRFKYTLPKSGKTIDFKLLTAGDQKKIDADIKGLQKFKNSNSKNLTTRMRHMILAVDGDENRETINRFIEHMLAADSRAFREYITKIQPDIDLEVEQEDPETGEIFRANFEIGLDLLYPDYKK